MRWSCKENAEGKLLSSIIFSSSILIIQKVHEVCKWDSSTTVSYFNFNLQG